MLCKQLGLLFIIAGDIRIANFVKAKGIHLSEDNFHKLKKWKFLKSNWIFTAASHSLKKNFQIAEAKLDAAIYSPIFHTRTHTDSEPIGHKKLHLNAQKTRGLRIYAMGGINSIKVKLLDNNLVYGIAGIRIFDYDKF